MLAVEQRACDLLTLASGRCVVIRRRAKSLAGQRSWLRCSAQHASSGPHTAQRRHHTHCKSTGVPTSPPIATLCFCIRMPHCAQE